MLKKQLKIFSVFSLQGNQLYMSQESKKRLTDDSQVSIQEVSLNVNSVNGVTENSKEDHEPSIKDPNKKSRDKMKKRILRSDPEYR